MTSPSCYIKAAPGKRIAMVHVMQLVSIGYGAYDTNGSKDLAVLARHDESYLNVAGKRKEAAELDVRMIKEAGFNCMSLWMMSADWWAGDGWNVSVDYMDAARKYDMKVVPDLWIYSGDADVDAAGKPLDKSGLLGSYLGKMKDGYDDVWLRDDSGRRMVMLQNGNSRRESYAKAMEKLCEKAPRSEIALSLYTKNGLTTNPGWMDDSVSHPSDAIWFDAADSFLS